MMLNESDNDETIDENSTEHEEEEQSSSNNNSNTNSNRLKFRTNNGGKKRKQPEDEELGERKKSSNKQRRSVDYKRELFNSLDVETKKMLIPLTNEDEIFAELSSKDDLQGKLELIRQIAQKQQKAVQRLEKEENRRTIQRAQKPKTQELYKLLKRGLDGDLKYERKIDNIIESYRAYELLKLFAIEELSRASNNDNTTEDDEEWNEEEAENKELYEQLYDLTRKEHRKLKDIDKKKLNKFLQNHAKHIMEKTNQGRWN